MHLGLKNEGETDGTPGREVPAFKRVAALLGPEANLASKDRIIDEAVVHNVESKEIERKFVQHLHQEAPEEKVWASPSDCEVCQEDIQSIQEADLSPPEQGREVVRTHPNPETHTVKECAHCGGSGTTSCSRCNGRGTREVTKEKTIKKDGEKVGSIEESEKKSCSCGSGRVSCGKCDRDGNRHIYTVVTHRYYTKITNIEVSDPDFPEPNTARGINTNANAVAIDADGWQTTSIEEIPDGTGNIETQGLQTEVVTQTLATTKVEYSVFGSRHTAYLAPSEDAVIYEDGDEPNRPLDQTKMAERAKTPRGKTRLAYVGYLGSIVGGLWLITWFATATALNSVASVVVGGLFIFISCRYVIPNLDARRDSVK